MLRLDSAQSLLMLQLKKNKTLALRNFRLLERDRYLRDAATALAVERYENSLLQDGVDTEVTAADDEESGLLKFLNWLIEHQDQIKALIQMIMSLFAGDK